MSGWAATVRACRLGMFVQAMVINLTPLLFVPLHDALALSWEQIGRLVLINFTTQLLVDLAGGWLVQGWGVRVLCVAAHLLAAAGLLVFAAAAGAGTGAYAVLMAGTVVFSAGCGLLEVLLSPLLNAVPAGRGAADMALLHAFYPLGKLAVIAGTGAVLWLAGFAWWPVVAAAWAAVPLAGALAFLRVPLPALPAGQDRQRLRDLVREPGFRAVLAVMALAGASELAVAQWTSAFAQRGLGCTQAVADLAGFALFAVGMAAGRLWFGWRGGRLPLAVVLAVSAAASAAAYLLAALSPWPWLALAACAGSGLTVSLLWPGTISLAAARWPLAGATVFACLAAVGDAGAAIGPWLVGVVADAAVWSWLPGGAAGGGRGRALRTESPADCFSGRGILLLFSGLYTD